MKTKILMIIMVLTLMISQVALADITNEFILLGGDEYISIEAIKDLEVDVIIENGKVKNALVIGAEVLTKVTDWTDRNTCVLFGDGAGAVVLQPSYYKGILASYCGSAGDKEGLLTIPAVPVRNPFVSEQPAASVISMQGQKVFKFAVKAMRKSIDKVLEDSNCKIADIKYVIPHQANTRIIDFVARKMRVDKKKFYRNIESLGNTSAATIPLAFNEMLSQGLLNKGDKIIMVGFGGGLTWGAVLVEL